MDVKVPKEKVTKEIRIALIHDHSKYDPKEQVWVLHVDSVPETTRQFYEDRGILNGEDFLPATEKEIEMLPPDWSKEPEKKEEVAEGDTSEPVSEISDTAPEVPFQYTEEVPEDRSSDTPVSEPEKEVTIEKADDDTSSIVLTEKTPVHLDLSSHIGLMASLRNIDFVSLPEDVKIKILTFMASSPVDDRDMSIAFDDFSRMTGLFCCYDRASYLKTEEESVFPASDWTAAIKNVFSPLEQAIFLYEHGTGEEE